MAKSLPKFPSLASLWDDGEVIPRHPRVRLCTVDEVSVVIHRRNSELPENKIIYNEETQRLLFLANRTPQSNVITIEKDFYLCHYIDGISFDQLTLTPSLIEKVAVEFIRLWQIDFSSSEVPQAHRERPILEPLGFRELAGTPIKALNLGRQHRTIVLAAQALLRESSTPKRFIHGDLKLDNLIQSPDKKIRLIDWECSGLGYLEEEMGSFLASVIFNALAKATMATMAHPNLSTESNYVPTENLLYQEVSAALRNTQKLSSRFLAVVASHGQVINKSALSGGVFISLLCRLQGAIIAGSTPTTVAVIETTLTTIAESGLTAFESWLEGK